MTAPQTDRTASPCPRIRSAAAGLGALLAVGLANAASPAMADTRTAQSQGRAAAIIARPIAVTGIDDLDFGMVASSGPGTVVIQAGAGAAVYGGSARQACNGAGSCPQPHAARFEVSGEALRNYRIALPERLSIDGPVSTQPGSELLVEDFSVRTTSQPLAGPKGKLDTQGCDSFEVGATLHISAALPPGRYRVSVPVIVTYD